MDDRAGRRRRLTGAMAALAVISAASLVPARALSYDAWGWLLWGQEILDGRGFTTDGYPTWKPLVGLVSVAIAPLGSAAPLVWLFIARAAAVIALWLAYRLASRVAGPVAGGLALVALIIVPQWVFQVAVGGSEPLLTALLLGAVACHADRNHHSGFLLVFLGALLRPEAWPLLLASAVPAWRRGGGTRVLVLAGLAAVPALWFGGEYLGSHDPFLGSRLATTSHEAVQLRRAWKLPGAGVLNIAWQMVPLPVLLATPMALLSGWRRRDIVVLALGLGAAVWVAEVAVLAQIGYAGVTRFLFPAAAGLAIVGAVGLVELARLARTRPAARVAVAAVACALALPALPHLVGVGAELHHAEERVDLNNAIGSIVARVGKRQLLAAHHLAAQGETITPVAWRLHVPAESLRTPQFPGLALTDEKQRWRLFRRALRRDHGRHRIQTIARAWALRLVYLEPSLRRASGRRPHART